MLELYKPYDLSVLITHDAQLEIVGQIPFPVDVHVSDVGIYVPLFRRIYKVNSLMFYNNTILRYHGQQWNMAIMDKEDIKHVYAVEIINTDSYTNHIFVSGVFFIAKNLYGTYLNTNISINEVLQELQKFNEYN